MASQGHPKPGRAPNGCYWDPHHEPSGAWRRKSDNEIHDKAEAAAALKQRRAAHRRTTAAAKQRNANQESRRRAAAVAARRNTRYMAARCNDTLFQPGNIEKLARVDVGTLGGTAGKEKCAHCGALLYGDEAVDSKWLVGCKRGRHCCSDGQVVLPAVKPLAAVDDLWRAKDDPKAKLLRANSRKFNNALALAYEQVEEPDVTGGSGFQPSVVIQGKLYHLLGPLQAEEGKAPAFAQLYVHDPAAANDVADKRYKHMYLPKSNTSQADRARCVELLKDLQAALRDANSYVKDFVSAGEIFSTEEVTDAQFVIDPTAAPKDEHARKYNDFNAFNEVSVMAVEPKGGQAPKRSIVVRARDG